MLFFPISTNHNSKFSFEVSNQEATCARIDIFHQFLVSSLSSSMGGRNIFLPGRFFPRKFPDFSGGLEEIANPAFSCSPRTCLFYAINTMVTDVLATSGARASTYHNSLWPSDTIRLHASRYTLVQRWLHTCLVPSHYLNQYVVNWNLRNKLNWNFNWHAHILFCRCHCQETHCGLMMPCGSIDQGHYWVR